MRRAWRGLFLRLKRSVMPLPMKLKDCTEGNHYREGAMEEALRCRNGELNANTIMDYIGFCCGIVGAGDTMVLPYGGKIFHVQIKIVEDIKPA